MVEKNVSHVSFTVDYARASERETAQFTKITKKGKGKGKNARERHFQTESSGKSIRPSSFKVAQYRGSTYNTCIVGSATTIDNDLLPLIFHLKTPS